MEKNTMKTTTLAAMVVLALGVQQAAAATATFYRFVDENGRVTYVDKLPTNFEGKVDTVIVDPDANTARLPDVAQSAAQSEAERVIRSGQLENASSQKRAESTLRAAESNLVAAKKALEEAQNNSLAEDWFYVAAGPDGRSHRVPRPAYAERLNALEANIKVAEANLADAQREYRLTY